MTRRGRTCSTSTSWTAFRFGPNITRPVRVVKALRPWSALPFDFASAIARRPLHPDLRRGRRRASESTPRQAPDTRNRTVPVDPPPRQGPELVLRLGQRGRNVEEMLGDIDIVLVMPVNPASVESVIKSQVGQIARCGR